MRKEPHNLTGQDRFCQNRENVHKRSWLLVLPNITIHLAISSHQEARYNCLMADDKPGSEMTSPPTPHNIPLVLLSFIGCEQEVKSFQKALAQTRLLTLTGTGGCGKSRLAVAVCERLRDNGRFPDGVWLIETAALNDSALVPSIIATS